MAAPSALLEPISYGDGFGPVKVPTVSGGSYSRNQLEHGQGKLTVSSNRELQRMLAVAVIEKWWRVVRDKKVFHMLKHAMCAAEYSLTREILRKVTPLEAQLLADPAIQAKIKFRFGGESFPPVILFKIFTSILCASSSEVGRIKYLSGRRIIRPSSEAAMDAKRQMGDRLFYQQVVRDMNEHEHFGATDEVDISTTKDYMQYMANTDECPAYLGGKENTWRRLDLKSLPRHNTLHILVDLLEPSRSVNIRKLEASLILQQKQQQQQQQQSQTRSRSAPSSEYQPSSSRPSRIRSEEASSGGQRSSGGGQRRSQQAKRRTEQMKKAYRGERDAPENRDTEAREEEIEDLYQWTQELSFDDIR